MNKNKVLIILLLFIITLVFGINFLNIKKRYNNLIVESNKWNEIIAKKEMNYDLNINEIKFNDYNLIIDKENKIIYYSLIDYKDKYNPYIFINDFKKDFKIVFNNKLDEDDIKVMIYNLNYYNIYSLKVVKMPLINIIYKDDKYLSSYNIPASIHLFDNNIKTFNKIVDSDGNFSIIEEDNKYLFSLIKNSLGRNKRNNNISVFGHPKDSNYQLNKTDDIKENTILLFINNKYMGTYNIDRI